MDVIRHDDVTTHRGVEILCRARREFCKCLVNICACEPWLSLMRAERDEVDRVGLGLKNEVEPGWSIAKRFAYHKTKG